MATNKIRIAFLFTLVAYIIMEIFANLGKLSLTISYSRCQYFLLLIVLTTVGYSARYIKWELFLKIAGLYLDYKQKFFIFFSGLVMALTPGKLGEIWNGSSERFLKTN